MAEAFESTIAAEDTISLREVEREYPSKEVAGRAACDWTGVTNPDTLVLYKARAGPAVGLVVGLAITRPSGKDEDIIRIDMDDIDPGPKSKTKGIHFNAKHVRRGETLASIITRTKSQKVPARRREFNRIVAKLQGESARTIWYWWSTGAGVWAVEDEIDEEDAGEAEEYERAKELGL